MIPRRLIPGDTIGVVSPSHVAVRERYQPMLEGLRRLGFQVKQAKNLYRDTYGYLASEQERAEDINAMVQDDTVRMILFGGGEGGNEVLPLLDYEAIARNPKIFLSYSDGTSILNAVYARTGLETYYGQTPGIFSDLRPYDEAQFRAHFLEGGVTHFTPNSPWITLTEGVGQGTLLGGYLGNMALLAGGPYLPLKERQYVLFLEDHEQFSPVARVSALLTHLEQGGLAGRVAGLLFGHYSAPVNEQLLERLRRFGECYQIPVAYCDDFGHGDNHAVMPIGRTARLDTAGGGLSFMEDQ